MGVDKGKSRPRALYRDHEKVEGEHINPYLTHHRVDIVPAIRRPAFVDVALEYGVYYSKSAGLIASAYEAKQLKDAGVPGKYLRKFLGSHEFIDGNVRYCLWISDRDRTAAEQHPAILERIQSVEADNGTESDVLQRSLQRALHRDPAARFVTSLEVGPLFADHPADDDLANGTIYVLRSKSDNPVVAANRNVLHKIGVTGGNIDARFAGAKLAPTFLLADVEIVATYELYNVNRVKLEGVIHRVFGAAQLEIEIKDRFGNPVRPREWFLVPRFVIDEAIAKIRDGSIVNFIYEPSSGELVHIKDRP